MSEAKDKLRRLEALSDEDLLERAWAELSALCGAEGRPKKWRMTIPVDADNDSDTLFGEVLKRYAELKRENEKYKKFVDEFAQDFTRKYHLFTTEEAR